MVATTFVEYDGTSNPSYLASSILGQGSGIQIVAGSVALSASAPTAVSLYDGSLTALGIGSGLLLTSGMVPGTSNTVGWFGSDNTQYAADGTSLNFYNGDPAIDAVVNTVFQTQSYDATMLSFDFTITDPAATSISFDIVFGSDEYPEWVDQFVDCAVIIVNGVNYAFFNHDPNAPLSVIGPNLAAGYFQDNAGNTLPIEYDGVSHVLRIVAPIRPGEVNSIKIGVADTGDHVYDSGIFISNMTAGTTPGSGVVLTPDVPCTGGDDIVSGTVADELIELLGGNDTAYAGGGDDIVVGGAGNDTIYGGSGNDVLEGGAGDDYLDGGEGLANEAAYTGSSTNYGVSFDAVTGKYALTGAEGSDTLTNIQLVKFADGLFDLGHDGLTLHSAVSGPVPNHAGSVVLSGAAMVGQTLVALVIDADGLPAPGEPISFDWLVSANGITWTDTGITANTYTLSNADAGLMVKAVVSYIDAVGQFEAPESAAVSVATANTTLTMALMELAAPDGAGVQNPLTTLLANAMALGFTANQAQTAIKAVLGLPSVNLGTYDPLAVLASQPTDTTALAVMKACAAVAMTVSVADPTGFNLTLAVMEAASQGQALDLADPAQLAAVLAGVDVATVDTIQNLNRDMANATSLNGKDGIAAVWNDFCGKVDNLAAYMGVVEVINLHLNLGPVGNSSAELPFGSEGASYTIDGSALLAGFSDPDGDPLVVSDLTTDPAAGGLLVDNGDGTWTFTPDPGFLGPVELSFIVSDPSGAGVAGSTLLVIAPPMPLDSTAPTVTIEDDAAGIANGDVTYTLTFSEDVTGLVPDSFMVTNGTVTAISGAGATYTVVVTPNSGFEGTLGVALNAGAVVDAAGNANDATVAIVQAIDTKAPVVGSMAYGQNDGTLKAGESVTLSVTLSEAALVSGQASIALANGGTASYVSGSGTNTLTFSYAVASGQDTGDLASALSGALTGTITDAAGNAVDAAGFNNVNPAGSLVVDTTAPLVASFSPTDGATGVAIGANLVLTFVEAIARGTGTITLRSGSATGAIVESFDAATSSRISLSGQTLTIDPISNLANNTRYFVVFSAGTVTDVAGNTFAGTSTYDFTTVVAGNVMNGTANADTLTGTAAVDIISGLGGNDVITGAGGIDVLNGGDGSDLYIVGTAADHGAAEFADTGVSGTDEVRFTSSTSGATLTLYAADSGIEKVAIGTGTASAAVTSGTTALNVNAAALTSGLALVGNAGANVLTSGGGNDTLTGNGGVDTFIVTAGTDTVTDLGNGGADVLNVAAGATINATVNTAWTASSSTVNKGAVAITTNGLAVNLAAVTSSAVGNRGYTITNVGAAATLTGSALADQLTGGGFNDVLVGGAGIDVLNGGNGGDIYIVATTTDHGAAEFADTGVSGADEVRFASSTAGATLTLYAGDSGIEKVAIGTGTASAAVATATTALNVNAAALAEGIMLVGNAGTNVLTGGSRNDTLRGEAGNDTLNGGAGFDYADYSTATASITANLAWTTVQNTGGAGNDMLNGIEGLIGGSAGDKLTGNGLDNILWGNAGNDILSGGDGADQLRGGNGSDTLTGGNGTDWFIFDTAPNASLNKDIITDFAAGTDELQFSKAAFTALAGAASGDLASDAFWAGAGVATAHDATDRFIYNTSTGALYYDADGTGSAAAVQIALLGTAIHPMLAYTDMSVIA